MKIDNKIIFLVVGILIGGIGIYLITSYFPNNSTYFGSMMSYQNSNKNNSDSIDAHFIEQMIPHHEDAIAMSRLALEKSQKEEVRTLAKNIIDAQTKEINEMNSWYKSWFGKEVPKDMDIMSGHGMMSNSQMHMGMMGDDSDFNNLKNSDDFDREYVSEMIPHHQMAIMMADMLKKSTNRLEMKELADNIINSQTSEIDMMREWLSEWEK